MHDLKIGDRIICKCDKNPNCRASKEEFTITEIDHKNKKVGMKADGDQIEPYCGNLPNAEIKVIKKEEKKEEKWIPVHETIVEFLKKNSDKYTEPYAKLYARGTRAPKQGISDLLKHFEAALPHSGGYLHEILEKAIRNLKEQQKEG